VYHWLSRYRGTSGGSLLQIGPSNDAFTSQALAAGYSVTIAPPGSPESPSSPGSANPHVTILHGGLAALRSETAAFDVIVLDTTLSHVRHALPLLETAHRLLKPEGTLVATSCDLRAWSNALSTDTGVRSLPTECSYYNATTLQSLLFKASFRNLVALPAEGPIRPAIADGRACVILAQPVPPRPRPLVSLIVPVYNEAATVASALDRLLAKEIEGLDIELVIIESNSTDGTRAVVERYRDHPRVKLVFESCPRGKGHAVREGFRHASGDFILIQDADLEYDLEDYEVLLEPLVAGRESFVLGARHGGRTWKLRRFNDQPLQAFALNAAHWGFTFMINVSLGIWLRDPFTMYKVFRRDCLHGLSFECNRFDFDWELLIKLVRKGYRPVEIPVNYRSRSFKEGKKVAFFRDPITWMIALVRARTQPIDLLQR